MTERRRWLRVTLLGLGLVLGGLERGADAQVPTSSVATSTVEAAAKPPKPRRVRKTRRTRRRRGPPVTTVRPPTRDDRSVFVEPAPRLVVGLTPPPPTEPIQEADSPVESVPTWLRSLPRRWGEAWNEAFWAVLSVLGVALLLLRIAAGLVRRAAHRGLRFAQTVERNWRLIEGLAWIGVGLWVIDRLASGPSMGAAAVATGVMALVVALAFNAIRDVISGFVLNLERPFEVGDYVRVAEAEGRVHAFRTRVVELIAPDGHRLLVPYRSLAGITDVRPGGRSAAHAVVVELGLPDNMDPADGLGLAEEVARASPWATLAANPKVDIVEGPPRTMRVEAFAFNAEAQPLLHADLVRSWASVCRKMMVRPT